ncbi:hypothetical protein B0H14DRAFT_3449481 [Mycena olivaceomarginata]|nr:hypothetical protein B0H14DRAFT_3449481 [Mycena olivaceomarginata]
MSTTDAILQNTAYHARLLAALASVDHAPPALVQQDTYIAGLERQARESAARIAEVQTQKEKGEHEALRDSVARRFAATITGRRERYEARAKYVEALEKEMQHKRQHATLGAMLEEAKAVQHDLQAKVDVYNQTKQDLSTLYRRIFDGPTQAFPEDDELEYQLHQAQVRYSEIQSCFAPEAQALRLLRAADAALQLCSAQVQEATSDSHWDMLGIFGRADDNLERHELRVAQRHATQAEMFVQQAMMSCPNVQAVGEITIAHGSFMSDVLFDNVFSDIAFHRKIKASARNVQDVQTNLTTQLDLAQARVNAVEADLKGAADALARARGALDAFGAACLRAWLRTAWTSTRIPLRPRRRGILVSDPPTQHMGNRSWLMYVFRSGADGNAAQVGSAACTCHEWAATQTLLRASRNKQARAAPSRISRAHGSGPRAVT